MQDLTTATGVYNHMVAATSKDDWNKRCDDVLRANGGKYPPFWYEEVLKVNLFSRLFGDDSSSNRLYIIPRIPLCTE